MSYIKRLQNDGVLSYKLTDEEVKKYSESAVMKAHFLIRDLAKSETKNTLDEP